MALEEECTCPFIEERVEWIYTYGDLVTLLLAFFILLFALAKTEEEKFKAVSAAFRGGPPASPFIFSGQPTFMENITSVIKKSEIGEETNVAVDDRGITVSFNDTAFFNAGSSELTKTGKDTIEKFASILYTIPNRVIIEGHTDDTPVAGQFPSNWELSAARSGSVARLLEYFGIKPNRIEIAAYGSTRPKVVNDSEKQRSINRRVDILIKPQNL